MKCLYNILVATVLIGVTVYADDADYVVELDKFEPFTSTDKDYFDPDTLRVARKGRNNFVISGDFKFMKNLGDETKMNFELKKKIGAQYEKVASGGDVFCKYLEEDTQYWPKIAEKSTMPSDVQCPFPKGDYTMKDFKIDEGFLPSTLPEGEYMAVITFTVNDEQAFGYNVGATITKN